MMGDDMRKRKNVYINTYILTYIYRHIYIIPVYVYVFLCVCIYIYSYVCVCVYIHTYICMTRPLCCAAEIGTTL